MSTVRRQKAQHLKDAAGKTICSCGCGGYPVPPRRTWVSDKCVDDWKVRNDPGHVRALVKKRDGGICALCGCDADKEFAAWQAARCEARRLQTWLERRHIDHVLAPIHGRNGPVTLTHLAWTPELPVGPPGFQRLDVFWKRKEADLQRLLGRANPGWTLNRDSGWDADHIIPVAEGGGQCGLDNYRTLCHICHKQVSREQRKRRTLVISRVVDPKGQ